jgi:long-chain acyl-CoA synthetase
MGNLAEILTLAARRFPDRAAIKLNATEVSYRELDEAASAVADLVRARGIRPGDRVGLMLPNVPDFPIVYYGILRAGGVAVPMNVMLKEREAEFYLADSGATAVFAWHEHEDVVRPAADAAGAAVVLVEPGRFDALLAEVALPGGHDERRDPDDTAVVLYTSGTTGRPKGAELTHEGLRRNAAAVVEMLRLAAEGEVIFGGLPLFHSFGQTSCMNTSVTAGATFTLLQRFDPGKTLEILQRDRVTVFEGVPTMYSALLHHPEHEAFDLSALRLCRDRRAARRSRRGGRCGRVAQARREGHAARDSGPRQGARCRLQVPAPRLGHRRTAEGPDGQDPEASDLDPGAARRGGCGARVIPRRATWR